MMRRMEEDDDNDDDDYDEYYYDDDVSGKQVATGQSRATFRAKQGSSTSPVDTMI